MNHRFVLPLIAFALLVCSCSKDVQDIYLYEVQQVDVSQSGVEKNNLKSDLEFISLAYSDLLDETISNQNLNRMILAYTSVGDKELIADILIRNLLNSPNANIPSNDVMRSDVDQFILDIYGKLFVREPNEYEAWFLKDMIDNDPDLTPEMIFYAFLTSDEYRYF
ncbi:MAG: hypothetical protein AAF587_05000 [Bacteroidota bacterium]